MRLDRRRLAFLTLRRGRDLLDKVAKSIDFHREIVSRGGCSRILPHEHEQRRVFYRCINDEVLKNGAIEFFEFGVYQGQSLQQWLEINTDRRSRFFGFDTFRGLPEAWGAKARGTFDVDGVVPDLKEERVRLVKGLFQESLRPFLAKYVPKARLVIHFDADLYSATLYCLVTMDRFIASDSLLIFDEFADLQHEYAAFHDYTRSHYRAFEILCRTEDFSRVALRVI